MIDSVVLKLEASQFKLLDSSYFDGKETKQVSGKFSVTSVFANPAKIAAQDGHYFPRITLPERSIKKVDGSKEKVRSLEIQVSLPKLIYDTNAIEVGNTDLEAILTRLLYCLEKVHIKTTKQELSKATLKRVDFSKIVRLPDYLGGARQASI
jgi:hypothetical protein